MIKKLFFLVTISIIGLNCQQAMATDLVIDFQTTGSLVTKDLYGMNVARWDKQLFPQNTNPIETSDTVSVKYLKELNLGFLKYPGGNDADSYIWDSHKNPAEDMDTTEFLHLLKDTKSTGFITVNFNEPPKLAADWFRHIKDKAGADAVPMWEVGDEVWGPWAKSHVPGEVYGERFNAFAKELRSVDPNVKLAANLSLSNPDTSWTQAALSSLGDNFSIVTITYFPQSPPKENDKDLFKAAEKYKHLFTRLENYVAKNHKVARPKYCLVGFNSTSTHPGPQTVEMANAVFMGQMYGVLAETGTDMACWWAFHNEYKERGGDYGIVAPEPLNRPHYTYHSLKLLSDKFRGKYLGNVKKDGLELVALKSENKNSIAFLLINTQTKPAKDVAISFLSEKSDEIVCVSSADSVTSDSTLAVPYKKLPVTVVKKPGKTKAQSTVELNVDTLAPYSVSVLVVKANVK